MYKRVGVFTGDVSDPYPCLCEIDDGRGGKISFTHQNIADLEYLISRMKKLAHELLPDSEKHEI